MTVAEAIVLSVACLLGAIWAVATIADDDR